jgi:hypothetical protein
MVWFLDASSPLLVVPMYIKIAPMKVPYIQEALGVSSLDAVEEYGSLG